MALFVGFAPAREISASQFSHGMAAIDAPLLQRVPVEFHGHFVRCRCVGRPFVASDAREYRRVDSALRLHRHSNLVRISPLARSSHVDRREVIEEDARMLQVVACGAFQSHSLRYHAFPFSDGEPAASRNGANAPCVSLSFSNSNCAR